MLQYVSMCKMVIRSMIIDHDAHVQYNNIITLYSRGESCSQFYFIFLTFTLTVFCTVVVGFLLLPLFLSFFAKINALPTLLTPIEPQSRFGGKLLENGVVCPPKRDYCGSKRVNNSFFVLHDGCLFFVRFFFHFVGGVVFGVAVVVVGRRRSHVCSCFLLVLR